MKHYLHHYSFSRLTSTRWLTRTIIALLLLFGLPTEQIHAGGTEQVMPTAANGTALHVFPGLGFGTYRGAQAENRLKITIRNNAIENIFFGFNPRQRNPNIGVATNAFYRIVDPSGTVVVGATAVPTAGAGFIPTYNQAIAGPNVAGGTPTGYAPLSYDPTMNGDYYIELYKSNDGGVTVDFTQGGELFFTFFDITVAETNGTRYPGRINSQKWNFITYDPATSIPSVDFSFEGDYFAYTADSSVVRVNFEAGFRPFGYTLAMTRYGITNTNDFMADRVSTYYGEQAPPLNDGFRVFLSRPDTNIFTIAPFSNAPVVPNQVYGCPGDYYIPLFVPDPGDVAILLDLNGTAGYQAGTTDRVLEKYDLAAGSHVISWNGLDGLGNPVLGNVNVIITATLFRGRTNVPMHDAEFNTNGLTVRSVYPNPAPVSRRMYWNDALLTAVGACPTGASVAQQQNNNTTGAGVVSNGLFDGRFGPAHAWDAAATFTTPASTVGGGSSTPELCDDFGNARTINTWFWSYDITSAPVTRTTPDCDNDGDGITDLDDLDDDNDGIADLTEHPSDPLLDHNGDGVPNYLDPAFPGYIDNNRDGVNDNFDNDGDGVINSFDLDADNDGILDVVEAGGIDTDGNGLVDGFVDVDGDGWIDLYDPRFSYIGRVPATINPRSHTSPDDCQTTNEPSHTITFNSGDIDAQGDPVLTFDLAGDYGNEAIENFRLLGEGGTPIGTTFDRTVSSNPAYVDCDPAMTFTVTIPRSRWNFWNNDGVVTITLQASAGVNFCANRSCISNTQVNYNYRSDECSIEPAPTHSIRANSGTTDVTSDITFNFSLQGDYGDISKTFTLTGEGGTAIGGTFTRVDSDNPTYASCATTPMNFSVTIPQADWNLWNDDGVVDIVLQAGANVVNCSNTSCITDLEFFDQTTLGSPIANLNSDGDLLPDFLDLDADNDGIPDVVESGGTDVNGDGRIDNYTDTDNDGHADVVDGDVGNDGISENLANVSIVTNADGNNDGRPDSYVRLDTDGDGLLDYIDLDTDNDGIPDVVEAGGVDRNGDGRADAYADLDNDGFNDVVDGDPTNALALADDSPGLNAANATTATGTDTNGDGRPDSYPNDDLDQDGIRNQVDLDADGDGILDVDEAGGQDANRDGQEDNYVDSDNDGFNDVVDGDVGNALAPGNDLAGGNTPSATTITGQDANGDGRPDNFPNDNLDGDANYNFLDIDADNDGIVDNTEAQATASYVAPAGTDADGDGMDDAYDNDDANFGGINSGLVPNNQDVADNPDYLDLDSDNADENDLIEGHDSDGDGVADAGSPANTGIGGTADTDGDGLLDGFDNDLASTDATNSGLTPNSHPNADGNSAERDWRESDVLLLDSDNDGVADLYDIDDDNDGILDIDEGYVCGLGDWTTNGFTFGTNYEPQMLNTGTMTTGAVDFTMVPVGTPTFQFLNVVAAIGGNGTEGLNFRSNQTTGPNDATDYVIRFNQSVYNVELFFGGLDNNDEIRAVAYSQGVSIDLGVSNFDIPAAAAASAANLTYVAPNIVRATGDAGNVDNTYQEAFRFNVQGPVDSIVFRAYKNDGSTGNVTLFISDFSYCLQADTDGDGVPNALDLDSDNDGIPDIVEAGGVDTDGDGVVDAFADVDSDGLSDELDNDDTDGPTGSNPCSPQAYCLTGSSTSILFDTNNDGTNDSDRDTDNDGIRDALDLDADNDGIPDVVEAGGTDTDGDGIADNYVDADGDGFNDILDGDVGNDGIAENINNALIITGVDINNDGQPDDYPFDDKDNDGVLDQLDLDADNDGIPDVVEADGTDVNGDGRIDNYVDADGDGFADSVDGDTDNDGTPDNTAQVLVLTGADGNGDGRPDDYPANDNDNDGILNHLDLDADNDGIPDVVEAGGVDTDGDGIAENFVDIDLDGFNDVVDGDPTNALAVGNDAAGANTANATTLTGADTDGDGRPDTYPNDDFDGDGVLNQYDLDADGDGILDVEEEGGLDANSDGIADNYIDIDNDGFNDDVDGDVGNDGIAENIANTTTRTGVDGNSDGRPDSYPEDNQDGDNNVNFLDIDADNDGIVDNTEAQATGSYIAPDGADADGDGIDDAYDNDDAIFGGPGSGLQPNNQDGTDQPDYLDLDSDNDIELDELEGHDTNGDNVVDGSDSPNAGTGIGGGADVDGDGLLDGFDNNTASTDPTNTNLTPNSHPDADGLTTERDWREVDYIQKDNDNDGIPDVVDLDDDNDGIPDTEELFCYGPSTPNTLDFTEGGLYPSGTDVANQPINFENGLQVVLSQDLIGAASSNFTRVQSGIHTGLTGWRFHNRTGGNVAHEARAIMDINQNMTGCFTLADFEDGERAAIFLYNDGVQIPFNEVQFSTTVYNSNVTLTAPNIVEAPAGATIGNASTDGSVLICTDRSVDSIVILNTERNAVLTLNFVLDEDNFCHELDADGDGIADYNDLDSDNDGIPDIVEAGGVDTDGDGVADDLTDTDGDGLVNSMDNDDTDGPTGNNPCSPQSACLLTNSTSNLLDVNADGINERDLDTDGDGIADHLDLDADNDGLPDVLEAGGTDQDGDGRIDNYADADGDGYNDVVDGDVGNDGTAENTAQALIVTGPDVTNDGRPDLFPNGDTDGDRILNYLDLDADNDGIPDVVEADGTDENGDGRIDNYVDADGDGYNDVVDGDTNNDGVADNTANSLILTGPDSNGDGDPDDYPNGDRDADGLVLDYLDLDSDNDGIPDVVEAYGVDINGDGRADGYLDTDGDGFNDVVDGDPNNALAAGDDSAASNTGNALQLTGPDTNGDGQPDSYPDGDFDGDGILDQLDLDSDNDGIPDVVEADGVDVNGDGRADNYRDNDGDGFNDNVDGDPINALATGTDTPGFNTGNALQLTGLDINNDGRPNSYPEGDSDFDTLLDQLDLDADNDGIADVVEVEGTDVNGDGKVDSYSDNDGDGFADIVDGDPTNALVVADDNPAANTSNALVLTGIDINFDGRPDNYPNDDNDEDLILDFVDTDSDNDGIPDVVEAGGVDGNGNGRVDNYSDSDNDGFSDIYDGDPDNSLALGDDNIDTNLGRVLQYTGADTDGDGVPNSYPDGDTDGDGLLDYMDIDADNDGIPDVIEAGGTDTNGDGRIDDFTDLDEDGYNDVVDADPNNIQAPNDDSPGQNFPSALVVTGPDTNNDGRPDSYLTDDFDGDSILNHLDLDADNDGVADVVEVGGTDVNGDGRADNYSDLDGDGFGDVVDGDPLNILGIGNDAPGLNTNDVLVLTNIDFNSDGKPDGYATDDIDRDSNPSFLDFDADNDGIPDVVESGGTDTNGDGRADNYTDSDGDGFGDVVDGDPTNALAVANDGVAANTSNAQTLTGADANLDGAPDDYPEDDNDNDGILNELDLDSDNDGIPDVVESGGTDTDGDGFADNFTDSDDDGLNDVVDGDPTNALALGSDVAGANTANAAQITGADTDGDGIPNSYPEDDFDNDGILNQLDLDADGDGILDIEEAQGEDANRDGQEDNYVDADGDGYNDVVDGDVGNDLIAENTAASTLVTGNDTDNDGVPNNYPPAGNLDLDSLPNFLDIDADNDGIVDNTEGLPTTAYIAPINIDLDEDGIDDAYDDDNSVFGSPGSGIIPNNQDGLDFPDYLDIDTDNDREPDVIEGHDTNGDGVINGADAPVANTGVGGTIDSDGDGLLDGYDNNTASNDATNASLQPISHPNADGQTAERDWREVPVDIDQDNDGIPDVVENYGGDSDGDGTPDYEDPDFCANNFQGISGWNCVTDGLPDPDDDLDGDGIPNYQDTDFGNCGGIVNGVCRNYDADGDGIPNHQDLDSDNDGLPDIVEAGGTDTDGDGVVDNLQDVDGDGLADIVDNNDTDGPEGSAACVPQPGCLLTTSTSNILDADNDGVTEQVVDKDGDGAMDFQDLDADNDGIPDVVEAGGVDVDGDGIADDFIDLDDDGFNDNNDGDVGNDGIAENTNSALQLTGADTDNDGRPNSYPEGDSDGDGILDQLDLDADNDGIPDVVEAGGTDRNGDGRIDNYTDADGDGLANSVDGDTNNDGTIDNNNALQLTGADTNNDGKADSYPVGDADGDGVLDYLDLDADNDGIPDVVEAGGTDANGDGIADNYVDNDNDGFNDVVDGDPTNALALGNDGVGANTANALVATGPDTNGDGAPDNYPNGDLDDDGILNHLDLDADNDGLLDILEAGGNDANSDGIEDGFVDTDNDGFNDQVDGDVGNDGTPENIANATTVTGADANNDGDPDTYPNDDFDGDGNVDFLDIDADNDGIVDNTEGQPTDNYNAPAGNDADGDGIDDTYDNDNTAFGGAGSGIEPNNQDGTDNPDYLDLDTDNDGIPDLVEGHDTDGDLVADAGSPANTGVTGGTVDADGDGLLDGFDNNVGSTDPTNSGLEPVSHPDQSNPVSFERDWREVNTTYAVNDVNTTVINIPVSSSVLTNDDDYEGNVQTITSVTIDTDGDGIPETVIAVGNTAAVGGQNENNTANANAGQFVLNPDGTYTYTPATNFIGEITVGYTMCDDGTPQSCDSAVLVIDVEPNPSTENGSVAPAPDVNLTYDDQPVSGQVLANDNDAEGDALIVAGSINVDTDGDGVVDATRPLGAPATIAGINIDGGAVTNAGTITQNPNGTYTFDPVPGFIGVVEYEYTVCDNGTPQSCEVTFVTINVLPRLKNSTSANDDEEFLDQGTTLNENVLTNDSDVEGDAQVGGVSLVTGPTNGTLVLNPDGTYTYTPNDPQFVGNDEFIYSVCDNGTPQVCDTATVYITILDVNKDYGDAPLVYGTPYHRASADANNDNIPDGGTDIWLGANIDYEEAPNAPGTDNFDDGVPFGTNTPGAFPRTVTPSTSYAVEVTITSATTDNAFYGMWVDWNDDGVYDDFYSGSIATTPGANTATITVTTPAAVGTNNVYVRMRVDDAPFTFPDFDGARTNGEVEDYRFFMNNPLPVELLNFTATLQGLNTGILDWSTASELNNAGFEIEHALPTNGTPDFQNIGFVTGNGTTLQMSEYQYTVENMISGVHYFRLKQVDFDGTYKYSPVRALTVKAPVVKDLFPTVVHAGSPTVFLQVGEEGRYTVEIMTVLGQTIEAYEAEMNPNSYHEIHFDISRYPSAVYLIRVSNGLTSNTEKIRVE